MIQRRAARTAVSTTAIGLAVACGTGERSLRLFDDLPPSGAGGTPTVSGSGAGGQPSAGLGGITQQAGRATGGSATGGGGLAGGGGASGGAGRACMIRNDCPDARWPACVNQFCVECEQDQDCAGKVEETRCNSEAHTCRECIVDAHCNSPEKCSPDGECEDD